MHLIHDIGLEFLCGILVTIACVFCGEWILWRTTTKPSRRVALFAGLLVFAPLVVVALTAFVNGFRVIDLMFKHGWYMHALLPVLFVPPQLGLAAGLFRPVNDSGALGWRIAAHVISLSFLVSNAINWCSPGYCGWFGFPLVFFQFTDAPSVINGVARQPPFSALALAVNMLCLLAVLAALAVVHWRTRGSQSA